MSMFSTASTGESVTMLFADGSLNLCRTLQSYISCQGYVHLIGFATSGEELLDLIRHGLRADVVVLDSLLPGLSLPEFFQVMAAVDYRPGVILTGMPYAQKIADKFLTLGVNYIMVKPYTLSDLMEAVYRQATDPRRLAAYAVSRCCEDFLSEMRCNRRLGGWFYLERILRHTVLDDKDYIAKELYLLAAGDQPVSIGSVTASVQRANDSLRTANSKGYDELCRAAGKPAGARLSNLELIRVLTEKIRRSGVVRPTCKG